MFRPPLIEISFCLFGFGLAQLIHQKRHGCHPDMSHGFRCHRGCFGLAGIIKVAQTFAQFLALEAGFSDRAGVIGRSRFRDEEVILPIPFHLKVCRANVNLRFNRAASSPNKLG